MIQAVGHPAGLLQSPHLVARDHPVLHDLLLVHVDEFRQRLHTFQRVKPRGSHLSVVEGVLHDDAERGVHLLAQHLRREHVLLVNLVVIWL